MKRYKGLSFIFAIFFFAFSLFFYVRAEKLERKIKGMLHFARKLERTVNDFEENLWNTSSVSLSKDNWLDIDQTNKKVVGNSNYPNLLSSDPYFSHYLPKILKPGFVPEGTLRVGCVGRPNDLHPFNYFRSVSEQYENCVPSLANLHVGKDSIWEGALALKIEERDLLDDPMVKEFRVYLRNDCYWQPLNPVYFPEKFELAAWFLKKHLVTAHDFKFHYDAVMNPYVSKVKASGLRSMYTNIIDLKVIDDFTFSVFCRSSEVKSIKESKKYTLPLSIYSAIYLMKPLPCFVYQYFPNGEKIIEEDQVPNIYQEHSEWARNFVSHWAGNYIVSCGPLIFAGMFDDRMCFERNRDYPFPYSCLYEKKIVFIKESIETFIQDFKNGKLDFCLEPSVHTTEMEEFYKSSEYAQQKARGEEIKTLLAKERSYYYVGWNCHSKLFEDKRVRQALAIAIDKQRLIEQQLDSTAVAVTGPFAYGSAEYNISVKDWCFSPEEASAILDSLGWIDIKGTGVREKIIEGKRVPFRFKLCYFAKSNFMKNVCEQIADSLKAIGVDCRLHGVDLADLSFVWNEKSFDAIMSSWKLGKTFQDPRPLWHSDFAEEKGSLNGVAFQSKKVDALIDQLSYKQSSHQMIPLYHAIHQILHEESPYLFLFTRKKKLLYREYIKNIFVPAQNKEIIPHAVDEDLYTGSLWIEDHE